VPGTRRPLFERDPAGNHATDTFLPFVWRRPV